MPSAEIITIGTELLLGETIDTNTRYIARALRGEGVDLYRTSTIGDNHERIAEILREGMQRAEIIITTGGLGPTIDDPTREAIALAVNVKTEFQIDLWEQIKKRFKRYGRIPTENNKRQAYIPFGAIPIENPVGTAPAFIYETDINCIIALPGVPTEMEYLIQHKILPYLREKYQLTGVIKTRILHTSGVGESQIDDRIGDLEQLSNPTVGLAAHAGQVDIRITAKAETEALADILISDIEEELRKRLNSWIYGVDNDTLEGTAIDNIKANNWYIAVVEANLGGSLIQKLANSEGPFKGGEVLTTALKPDELVDIVHEICQSRGAQVGIGVSLAPGESQQTLDIVLSLPDEERKEIFSYGGPPLLAPRWAVNLSLDLIRKL